MNFEHHFCVKIFGWGIYIYLVELSLCLSFTGVESPELKLAGKAWIEDSAIQWPVQNHIALAHGSQTQMLYLFEMDVWYGTL